MSSSESKDKKTRFSGEGITSFVIGVLSLGYYLWIFSNIVDASLLGFGAIFCSVGLMFNLFGIYFAVNGFRKGDNIFSLLGVLSNVSSIFIAINTV